MINVFCPTPRTIMLATATQTNSGSINEHVFPEKSAVKNSPQYIKPHRIMISSPAVEVFLDTDFYILLFTSNYVSASAVQPVWYKVLSIQKLHSLADNILAEIWLQIAQV